MATKKKTVSKGLKKVTRQAKPVVKKAARKKKEPTAFELALSVSLQDPKIWGTSYPDVKISHFIDLPTANDLVRRFNKRSTAIPKKSFMQPEHFDATIFRELLKRKEVTGIRAYFGLNKKNKIRLVFVGFDKDHNDVYVKKPLKSAKSLLAQSADPAGDDEEGAIDMAQGCPSYGTNNPVMLPGN